MCICFIAFITECIVLFETSWLIIWWIVTYHFSTFQLSLQTVWSLLSGIVSISSMHKNLILSFFKLIRLIHHVLSFYLIYQLFLFGGMRIFVSCFTFVKLWMSYALGLMHIQCLFLIIWNYVLQLLWWPVCFLHFSYYHS